MSRATDNAWNVGRDAWYDDLPCPYHIDALIAAWTQGYNCSRRNDPHRMEG